MAIALKLSDDLVEMAKPHAAAEHRSVPKQIEYWARLDQRCHILCPPGKPEHVSRKTMGRTILVYLFLLSLYGCSEQSSSSIAGAIRLSDGDSSQLFVMPDGLKVEQRTQSLLFFRVAYPGMSARAPEGRPQDDEIAVWISQGSHIGRGDALVKQAAEKIDPLRPGQFYRDGKEGEFEIYRGMLDKTTSLPQSTIYVFRDSDGELVAVEDSGSWSRAYNVSRKIGPRLHVRYNIAKSLGHDFVEIDKVVKAFILKHAASGA